MSLDSYTVGFVVITSVIGVSLVGLWLVRRKIDAMHIRECHEVAGYLLGVVGTMYAVLLGLVVVDAMNKFQTASTIAQQEANSLADIFLLSSKLPQGKRTEIQQLCVDYANQVISREWDEMDEGQMSPQARRDVMRVIKAIYGCEPVTESEKAVYPMIVQQACQLWENRQARTAIATKGLPKIEWFVLIVGGFATVLFTYFFVLDQVHSQMIMTGTVALLIALNLYLVLLFAYPFSGDLKVPPDQFHTDMLLFNNQLGLNGGQNGSQTVRLN